MTQCLQVAAFPGKSLATKSRYQIFRIIANEGYLPLLLLALRAHLAQVVYTNPWMRQLPVLCRG